MYTFQGLYELYQTMTRDTSAPNLVQGKLMINATHKLILGQYNFSFAESTFTKTTAAGQQTYDWGVEVRKPTSIQVTVGSITYTLKEVKNKDVFNRMNYLGTGFTSNIPTHFHIRNGQALIYPTPAASGNTITFYFSKMVKDMTAADYTAGTITTLANGGTAVTGAGTSWTSAMIGRYIKITSNGFWYRITAVGGATSLTIGKPYEGTAISGGSEAYTIGELPVVPEEYQDLLWYRPVGLYWKSKGTRELIAQGNTFFTGDNKRPGLFESQLEELKKAYSSPTTDTFYSEGDAYIVDPNYDPRAIEITQ